MAHYVIKSWQAGAQPLAGTDVFVQIEGRASGLLAWLLALLKINPTIKLSARSDRMIFEEGSLEGSKVYQTPLENICSTFYGFTKPVKEAVLLGILVGFLTFWLLAIPGIVFGLLYYFLKKTLTIGYTDIGGFAHSISFSRSVIEGQHIDEAAAARVCAIIQELVDTRREAKGGVRQS